MILNIAPRFDDATEYSFRWNRRLMAEVPGEKVELLEGDAVRAKVEEKLRSLKPGLVVFYDHGDVDRLVGNDGAPCIDLDNASLLDGAEVYTMACLSARELGVEAWRRGCGAYWGYVEEFGFTVDDMEMFEELAGLGLLARLLKGMSWAEAKKEVQAKADYMIDKALSKGNFAAAMLIRENTDALRVWDGEKPETKCFFRKLAIKLFGPERGWRLLGSRRGPGG
jgi:hypothetical protein